MKKIQILVLEDNKDDIEALMVALPTKTFEIAGVAKTLKDAIILYKTLNIDIVIIDIFLQGEPIGITFASRIGTSYSPKPFIFLTSSIDKSIFEKAKLTAPYNYLIKPFNTPELLFSIELALEQFAKKEGAFDNKEPVFITDSFFVKDGQSLVKLSPDDIQYIQVDGPYCNMVTDKGKYILQISLSKFMKELPTNQFLKTHRNYMVNTKKIKAIYPYDNLILLTGEKKIILSRRYKEAFLKNYKIFR
ncbi:response regulator transcription factor [Flavivirga aquimarina]|uniref:Response regulator transcription factor n=1 Tax=Flavivirga aquimarina TaxID=2027862 RepID=A0ABT8WBN3_9FLAO|nr:response regulator transcription factor [Flavivirga aquimarina]MDO5970520.1 response regulator transcription factor [Flavivirga aquimarina]